jgi:hypothetical protein
MLDQTQILNVWEWFINLIYCYQEENENKTNIQRKTRTNYKYQRIIRNCKSKNDSQYNDKTIYKGQKVIKHYTSN